MSLGAQGGGIYTNTAQVSLTSSTVSENFSSERGGGINTNFGALTLTNSTISGNSSLGRGGGIYTEFGEVLIKGSTVSGNSSLLSDGGGISTREGALTLDSSTVTGNSSSDAGGGVYVRWSSANPTLTIQNSIIAGNTATNFAPDLRPDAESTLNINFSLIGDTNGSRVTAATGTGNQLNIDPLLGPLADNGGPTFTHALLAGSPALDAGNSILVTDQRGLTRPIDFAAVSNPSGGNGSDIGAFEQQTEFSSLIVTTAMDVVDNTDFVTSLREAINFANSQAGVDTITFDSTVFTGGLSSLVRLSGTELQITEALTIDGSNGTDVVISGDALGNDTPVTGSFITDVDASLTADPTSLDDNSRVLNFTAASGNLTLTSLTITGGRTAGESDLGGGVQFLGDGLVTIDQSNLSGNSNAGEFADGGGLYASSGSVTLTGSTVSGNRGRQGGGIFSAAGAVSLTSSTVSGNTASGEGGGIYNAEGIMSLSSSTVSGNTAGDNGGGILSRGGVSLTSSTISGNAAGADGGGIFTETDLIGITTIITNSTISGNTAGDAGGGIYAFGLTQILNSTIANNTAAVGGGVATYGDSDTSTQVSSSIIARNTATNAGNDVSSHSASDFDNSFVSLGFNLIGDGQFTGVDFFTNGTGGDIVGTTATPIDPLLGPLADNGGSTLTHALLVGSPALNAGDPSFAVPPDVDQRGVGFDRVVGGLIDIGALEQQAEFPSLVVTTNQDVVNSTDFVTSLREAINLANSQAGPDTITFDSNVFTGGANSLIRLNGTELVISESLTIDGSTGTDVVISGDAAGNDTPVTGTFITDVDASDAAGTLTDNSRVLRFTAGSGESLSLNSLTITGGRTTGFAAPGGGVSATNGSITLVAATVSGNSTTGDLSQGGGIYTVTGAVTLMSSTISGNRTTGPGSDGGGIRTNTGAVKLTDSTVSGNTTTGINAEGGGIAATAGAVTLNSSTVSGNSTTGTLAEGGGVYVYIGELTLSNSTVTGNSSGADGGGVFVPDNLTNQPLTIQNSIVASNNATGNTPDLQLDPDSPLNIDFSLIGDTTGSGVTAATGTGNVLDVDPLLGPLADNGGPTLTHALLAGSPALDAGDLELPRST